MSSRPPMGAVQALLTSRVVALALLLTGVSVVVAGAVLTMPDAELQAERDSGTLLFTGWVAAAIAATAGWWTLWRRAAGLAAEPRARSEMEAGRLEAGHVVQRLVAGWALLEAQLMIALVVSLLGNTPMLLVPALTLFAIGVLLSFPRREWFAPFARVDGAPPSGRAG